MTILPLRRSEGLISITWGLEYVSVTRQLHVSMTMLGVDLDHLGRKIPFE